MRMRVYRDFSRRVDVGRFASRVCAHAHRESDFYPSLGISPLGGISADSRLGVSALSEGSLGTVSALVAFCGVSGFTASC